MQAGSHQAPPELISCLDSLTGGSTDISRFEIGNILLVNAKNIICHDFYLLDFLNIDHINIYLAGDIKIAMSEDDHG